jgi:hypothetical protein
VYDLPLTLQDVNHPGRKRMGRDWPVKPSLGFTQKPTATTIRQSPLLCRNRLG